MTTLDYLIDCKAQRMPYWERGEVAKQRGVVFTVFVPREGALSWIKPGSGIVGVADLIEDRVTIFYEGGIYSRQPRAYEDLVYHAADRMAVDYPTIAKAFVPSTDLIEVGYFAYATNDLQITNQAALDAWRA